jgi:hypothetical protein
MPPDTPSADGTYPKWDEIRERAWMTMAQNELDARDAGLVEQRDPHELDMEPLGAMSDERLREMVETGHAPDGFELEHRIPQRVVGYMVDAGMDPNQAAQLAHLGDPANLIVVPRELHAVFDDYAKFGRNPTLEASLDDRREFPFRSMTDDQLDAAKLAALDLPADPKTAEGRDRLQELLDAEYDARHPNLPE